LENLLTYELCHGNRRRVDLEGLLARRPPIQPDLLRVFIVVGAVAAYFWWIAAPTILLAFSLTWLIDELFHYRSNVERVLLVISALYLWLLFLRWITPDGWWLKRFRLAMDEPSFSKAGQVALLATTGYFLFKIAGL